jgi:hypothetical protein
LYCTRSSKDESAHIPNLVARRVARLRNRAAKALDGRLVGLLDDLELRAAAVAFVVLEPRLTEMGELVLEPAGDDVDREPSARQVVGGRAQLGQDRRLPQPRMDRRDHLQPLGGQQQCHGEARDSCWYSAP